METNSTDDTETEFSGKVGISVAATDALGVYGELSGATNGEDSSGDNIVDWGAKIGAKFTF
jgi:outer membrane autotransporter protein